MYYDEDFFGTIFLLLILNKKVQKKSPTQGSHINGDLDNSLFELVM